MSASPLPSPDPAGYILWAGTVGFSTPPAERFAAAAATGCARVTLSPPDVLRAAESGTTAVAIGRQARDLGLELIMDPVMNWYPDREPSPSRFAGVSTDEALGMCEALGVVSLSVIATASSDVPVPDLAGYFGRMCDRARRFRRSGPPGVHPVHDRAQPADSLGHRPRRRSSQRRPGLRHLALLPRRARVRGAGRGAWRPDLLCPARRRHGGAARLAAGGDQQAAAARRGRA